MRHTHCRTWNMARKLTNEENEKLTLQDLGYGEKTEKRVKREMHTVGPGYCEKTDKRGK